MCFKHFKERKHYYGKTSENENEASFFLNDRYSFSMKKNDRQVYKKFRRHVSKLDVFIWLTVKCYSEVSAKRYWRI